MPWQEGARTPAREGGDVLTPPEIGYQDSSTTEGLLSARAGDQKDKIMGKLQT